MEFLTPPALGTSFFGRRELMGHTLKKIDDFVLRDKKFGLGLLGTAHTGKTSCLYEIARRVHKKHTNRVETVIIHADEIGNESKFIAQLTDEAPYSYKDYKSWEHYAEAVLAFIEERTKKTLVLIDNFEETTPRKKLVSWLRTNFQKSRNLGLILTASPEEAKQKIFGYDQPFYGQFEIEYLENFSEAQTVKWLDQLLGKTFSKRHKKELYTLSEGNPLWIKLLAFPFSWKPEIQNDDDFQDLIDLGLCLAYHYFAERWQTFSPQQRSLLQALARAYTNNIPRTLSEIADLACYSNASSIGVQMNRLLESDVLYKEGKIYHLKPVWQRWFLLKSTTSELPVSQKWTRFLPTGAISGEVSPQATSEDLQYKARQFETQVAELFRLTNYHVETNVSLKGSQVDVLATTASGLIRSRIAIECKYLQKRVGRDDVAQFIQRTQLLRQTNSIDLGMLVTSSDFTAEAKTIAADHSGMHLKTYSELLKELIDFTPYLQSLIADYESDAKNLKESYIEQNIKLEDRPERPQVISLNEYVDQWLLEEDQNLLVLLGEYGTGKTTFCQHYAYRMAQQHREDHTEPIPILVNLRDYAKAVDLETLIIQVLMDQYGLSNVNRFTLRKMHESGLFLLIFDGFDEMAQKIDLKEKEHNFEQIEALSQRSAKSKILLTCREEYFRSQGEQQRILKDIETKENYQSIHLQPFDDLQIQQFLQWHSDQPDYYWTKINEIFDLRDLAKRPVLLELIINYLPKIIQEKQPNEKIKASDLYHFCIQDELNRVLIEKDRTMPPEKKWKLLQQLTVWLFLNDTLSIPVRFMETELELGEFFNTTRAWEIERSLNEFLTFSFLIKEADDVFRISHKSFRDYLVALAFTEEVNRGEIKDFAIKRITPEIQTFMLEQPLDSNHLFALVKKATNFSQNRKFQGTNAANLLLSLDKAALRGKQLPDCQLSAVDFQNCDLTETNLEGANLSQCKFTNTILEKTNCRQADFTDAEFYEMGGVLSIDISHNGKLLASGGLDNQVKIWDISDLQNIKEVQVLKGDIEQVNSVKFSRDGQTLLSGGSGSTLKLWNLEGGVIRTFEGHTNIVMSVSFSHNGQHIVSSGGGGQVRLWDFGGNFLQSFEGHSDYAWGACFGHEDRFILSGSIDKTMKLWNIEGKLIQNFEHNSDVCSVNFSHNYQYVVSGGENDIKLWDIKGNHIQTFEGDLGQIFDVQFSKDDQKLLSAGSDKTIKLWNIDGTLIHSFEGHISHVLSATFHQEECYIISGSLDATIKIWDTDPESPDFGKCLHTIEQKSNCKGMQIEQAQGLDIKGFEVKKDEESKYDTREGSLKEWLQERGAID